MHFVSTPYSDSEGDIFEEGTCLGSIWTYPGSNTGDEKNMTEDIWYLFLVKIG